MVLFQFFNALKNFYEFAIDRFLNGAFFNAEPASYPARMNPLLFCGLFCS